MAVTGIITTVLQKAEKLLIFQEIGGCLNSIGLLQISVLVKPTSFKCIFVRFGAFFIQGIK